MTTLDGHFVSLDASTGGIGLNVATGVPIRSSVAVHEGVAWFGTKYIIMQFFK